MSLVTYITASAVGLVPTAILNCYMGTTLRRMEDVFTDEKNQATGWIVLFVQVCVISGSHSFDAGFL